MSLSQLRSVNFGASKANLTGSTGIGFTLLDRFGNVSQTRTTLGVHQLMSGTGIYACNISFSDDFHGSILWDTGEAEPDLIFASEQYNVEENDPRVAQNNLLLQQLTSSVDVLTGSMTVALTNIQFLVDMEGGRWKLNPNTNQMEFYKADNFTLVAKFSLFDINGAPTIDQVTERQRV